MALPRPVGRSVVAAVALAFAITGGAVVVGGADGPGRSPSSSVAVAPGALRGADLDRGVEALQAHLRDQPRDFGAWATLGTAYVEQARTRGDPSRYREAARALDRSLEIRPRNDAGLAGRAALAAARHDFAGALRYAQAALGVNPRSEGALASRIDALVELGRYGAAARAADEADARRPGVPVFTRYAYVRELRGDVAGARRALSLALGSGAGAGSGGGDVAYVATALGQLAWRQGQYAEALKQCGKALRADASYLPALECRARAWAGQGDTERAIRGLREVVARAPLPGPLVALGELYEARGGPGDAAKARQQYGLVSAWVSLARANGVNADLDAAVALTDHGTRAERRAALRAARAEWGRRHTVHTADALAWALHVDGRSEEALPYARRSTATGFREASFMHHRGVIEGATGHASAARRWKSAALDLNPGFSPTAAARAPRETGEGS
ncbi:tetratricopeptide repeat protein [Streptomyces longisporoflavus]|uniref:Tetratricopeptide repeat protein n=1 Tax=Streptomyces longisporoflavus TaxID=28044 RepID=A0ABW7R1S3_9ACTN